MNLTPTWSEVFAENDFEAVHWSIIGDPRAEDYTLMEWARANGYVVFTHDLDFGAILTATQTASPSVVQVRTQDTLPASIGNLVIGALRQFKSELEEGALLILDENRSRVRILPISR